VSAATRQRIEAVATRMQYSPNLVAQQLRGVSSRTLGVILDTVNTPVMSQRLFALESEASRGGFRLLVGQTHGNADMLREYVLDFAGRGVGAILGLFDLAPDRDARAKAGFGRFRSVLFHGRPAWPRGYCVRVDTEKAITECVDHLRSRGHKRIGLALGNTVNDELMRLRQDVFERQTARHDTKGFVWNAESEESVPTAEVIQRGIDHLVGKCRVDAILGSNDVWATRFILQLQASGRRVPADVAVIGYDNLDIASVVSPSLTTIDQCHHDYAVAALEMLLAMTAHQRIPVEKRIRTILPKLIVRHSS
jgi:DNA-binding LacI/PurR family transcriptional regulator